MSRPKTAVIAAAGYGGRMMPVTKAISKEMLPVYNRPIIDYAVENAVKAGVERIVFITRQEDDQLRTFYSKPKDSLVSGLNSIGKTKILPALAHLHTQAQYEFINQPNNGKYGTGLLPIMAAPALEGESNFILLAGDNAAYRADGQELNMMVDAMEQRNFDSAIACSEVPKNLVSRYGVIDYQEDSNKVFTRIVEKPELEAAPSNLINISNYVFNVDIIDLCKQIERTDQEYLLTDVFEEYSTVHPMLVWPISGDFIDVGKPDSFVRANQLVANSIKA